MDNVLVDKKILYVNASLYNTICDIDVYSFPKRYSNRILYYSKEPKVYYAPKGLIEDTVRAHKQPWNLNTIIGSKVFISPSSKISRDLVRKSYTITRKKDDADYIIIPYLNDKLFSSHYVNIIIEEISSNTVFLVFINNKTHRELDKDDYERVISSFLSNQNIPVTDSECFYHESTFKAYFVPNIKEYEDILRGDNRNYVFDNWLIIDADNKVSVETLDLWNRMGNDISMFESCVLNSDAKEYPYTMSKFINSNMNFKYADWNEKMKYLLKSMGIYYYNEFEQTRVVSPQDWNMWQKWVMHCLGVDEKGGFTQKNVSDDLKKEIRYKTAVVPTFIDNPMTVHDIKSSML